MRKSYKTDPHTKAHQIRSDVYEGAPTPVTLFMACVIKAAAVGAALRVLWGGFLEAIVFWSGAIAFVAVLTMFVANVVALRQRSVKRMLAYSSIAHAGYIMLAVLSPSPEFGGGAAILFYLVVYTVMTLGAFGVVLAVTGPVIAEKDADDITQFNGLGYSRPYLGVLMSLFLLSLAGIPPGMAGLLGKFYVFGAAIKAGYWGLSVVGVLCSAVSVYYYLRVIVAMYFLEPEDSSRRVPPLGFSMNGALTLCALGVVLLGLFPSALYQRAAEVMAAF